MLKEMQNDKLAESLFDVNSDVEKFKERMLSWTNPVEFVNNMYGSHPDDDGSDYFNQIFTK
jgi:hypothetical protein